jgi:hypothetical protein
LFGGLAVIAIAVIVILRVTHKQNKRAGEKSYQKNRKDAYQKTQSTRNGIIAATGKSIAGMDAGMELGRVPSGGGSRADRLKTMQSGKVVAAAAADWTPIKDAKTGQTYYHNQQTGETSWNQPPSATLRHSNPMAPVS